MTEGGVSEMEAGTGDQVVKEWAIVELMGHRTRAGSVSEIERFGGKFLQIDIPQHDGTMVTELYSPSSIYAFRPCSKEVVRQSIPRPPSYYRAQLPSPEPDDAEFEDGGNLEDPGLFD